MKKRKAGNGVSIQVLTLAPLPKKIYHESKSKSKSKSTTKTETKAEWKLKSALQFLLPVCLINLISAYISLPGLLGFREHKISGQNQNLLVLSQDGKKWTPGFSFSAALIFKGKEKS